MKTLLVLVLHATALMLQAAEPPKPTKATIYIEAQDGFETYIAAAFAKKKVPADVVTRKEKAGYFLAASTVAVNKESAGSKVARCLFLYCAGIEDRANVSVQLIDAGSSKVVWAYAVNKQRGHKNEQSMAEAVAKHLRDYLNSAPAARPTSTGSASTATPIVVPGNPEVTKTTDVSNTLGTPSVLSSPSSALRQHTEGDLGTPDSSAAAQSRTPGTLSITSAPDGAEIFVDSVGSGHTPVILKVTPGMHSVQLTKAGYKDSVSKVTISPGGIVNVTATLEK